MGNSIEDRYQSSISKLTGTERVTRSIDDFGFVYRMLTNKVLRTDQNLTETELRVKVASQMYGGEPQIDLLLKKVSS